MKSDNKIRILAEDACETGLFSLSRRSWKYSGEHKSEECFEYSLRVSGDRTVEIIYIKSNGRRLAYDVHGVCFSTLVDDAGLLDRPWTVSDYMERYGPRVIDSIELDTSTLARIARLSKGRIVIEGRLDRKGARNKSVEEEIAKAFEQNFESRPFEAYPYVKLMMELVGKANRSSDII